MEGGAAGKLQPRNRADKCLGLGGLWGEARGKPPGFGLELALGPVALEVGLETAGLEAGFDQTLLLVIKSY